MLIYRIVMCTTDATDVSNIYLDPLRSAHACREAYRRLEALGGATLGIGLISDRSAGFWFHARS